MRSKAILIRTTEEEKNQLQEAAEKISLDLSSFMRSVSISEASKILQNKQEK